MPPSGLEVVNRPLKPSETIRAGGWCYKTKHISHFLSFESSQRREEKLAVTGIFLSSSKVRQSPSQPNELKLACDGVGKRGNLITLSAYQRLPFTLPKSNLDIYILSKNRKLSIIHYPELVIQLTRRKYWRALVPVIRKWGHGEIKDIKAIYPQSLPWQGGLGDHGTSIFPTLLLDWIHYIVIGFYGGIIMVPSKTESWVCPPCLLRLGSDHDHDLYHSQCSANTHPMWSIYLVPKYAHGIADSQILWHIVKCFLQDLMGW